MNKSELRIAAIILATALAVAAFYHWYMAPYRTCIHEYVSTTGGEGAAAAHCLKAMTGQPP